MINKPNKQVTIFYVFKESGVLVVYCKCRWREVDAYTQAERNADVWQDKTRAWLVKQRLVAEIVPVVFTPWHRRDRDRELLRPQDECFPK